ncbi:MAG: hypothetical protein P4L59_18825 [Desulfosporosinus sp.]|nr:hypothetical protein [Desulfosporosinus sp.]
MDNDYIFRRELDFSTELPEMICQLKKDRQFRKLDTAQKKELYDECYAVAKHIFLSDYVSKEEKSAIEKAASQQIMERARQEWEKTLIKEGYYDG